MKIVSLCSGCSQCPVVKITDTRVEIGEKGNTCVLTKEQWEALKDKILKRELQGRKPKIEASGAYPIEMRIP